VPQPLPAAPSGHPTIAGIPFARQRVRNDFISWIEPPIAGTSGTPVSNASASVASIAEILAARCKGDNSRNRNVGARETCGLGIEEDRGKCMTSSLAGKTDRRTIPAR
jgi:hypothetical protein